MRLHLSTLLPLGMSSCSSGRSRRALRHQSSGTPSLQVCSVICAQLLAAMQEPNLHGMQTLLPGLSLYILIVQRIYAGLRGMAARDSIAAGEVLASVPVGAALLVGPKERCSLPRDFCEAAFYARQPWYIHPASPWPCLHQCWRWPGSHCMHARLCTLSWQSHVSC